VIHVGWLRLITGVAYGVLWGFLVIWAAAEFGNRPLPAGWGVLLGLNGAAFMGMILWGLAELAVQDDDHE
jgi:hypothetical protein